MEREMGKLRTKVLIHRFDYWQKTVKGTSFKMSLFYSFPRSLCCVWWVDACQAVDIQNWNKKAFRCSGAKANPMNPHTMHLLPARLWPKTPVGPTGLFSTGCLPLILNLSPHVATGVLDFGISIDWLSCLMFPVWNSPILAWITKINSPN